MILRWKAGSRQKPVYTEDGKDGKANIVTENCGDGEEGWYDTIAGNFRLLEAASLEALLAAGPGMFVLDTWPCRGVTLASEELMLLSNDDSLGSDSAAGCLAALGAHPTAVEGGKAQKTKHHEKPAALVSKQASTGIFRPKKTQPEDYVLASDTLEDLDILGASAGVSTGPQIVKKRKPAGTLAGAPSKKPTFRCQKMTSLDVHEAQPSSGKCLSSETLLLDVELSLNFCFFFVVVVTTLIHPPPPSPPSMPAGDERRVEEPEHNFQVENVVEDASSHEAVVHVVTEPVARTTVPDDIIDAFDNVIDPTINQGLTEGGGAHAQTSPRFEYASNSGAGGGGDPDQNLIQPNETPLEYYFRMDAQSIHPFPPPPMEYKARGCDE
ncbi:hypothetical protein HanHA300_Chr05g0176081 [Helianthus annuus]|nr:hypothetical protein HanHA300_Chr05g0176081 [Helianthus annuus]